MKNRIDFCGERSDCVQKNNLADTGGLDRGCGTGREPDAVTLHRRRNRLEANDRIGPGANSEAGKFAGNSAAAAGEFGGGGIGADRPAADLARIPEGVRASVASKPGEYDARRLRSQRDIIRDVMISAADCETWLTLGELRSLTRYGEASISAQLRHLRKTENGGYDVVKRHRDGVSPERPGTDGRGECVWEYRITRGICGVEMGGTNSGEVGAVA